ncbi:MAG: class I SAM-dependent methyltransferase [Rhodospirillaceae bacterium]
MPRKIDPAVHFDDEMSVRYDAFVPRLVPDYAHLHELVVAQLGLALDAHARLLIVGAGTCTEILTLTDFDPTWTFVAVEPSAPMIDVARARIADAGLTDRVTFHVGTLDTLADQGPFEAATAILMMQFVPADEKAALFSEVAQRLAPGAPFLMAHPIGDPESDEHALAMQAWRDHLAEAMPDRVDTVFATVQDTLHFVSDTVQTNMLHDVGFDDVVRFHSKLVFGAWISVKAR